MVRHFGYGIFVLATATLLASCGALPTSGPLSGEVVTEQAPAGVLGGYVMVDVDERVASISASQPRESFKRVFANVRPAPDLRIGVSDTVEVTIWEAAAGGLFSASATDKSISAGSRTATLPEQVVARDGTIESSLCGAAASRRPSPGRS